MYTEEHKHCYGPLSWTAIITGALVGLGLSFLIGLFNTGIGLSLLKYSPEGVATVATGGVVSLIIGSVVTMFLAGWIAGYLGRHHSCNEHMGVLHGFTSWCLSLVFLLALFAPNAGTLMYGSQLLSRVVEPHTNVHVTTHENAPIVSTPSENSSEVTVNAQKATNALGLSTLVAFLVFFLTAIASSLGGYFAMACKRHCETPIRNTPHQPM